MAEIQVASVDVDDILKVTVDYGKLTFVLRNVLDRLSVLEKRENEPAQLQSPAAKPDWEPRTAVLESQLGEIPTRIDNLQRQVQALETRTAGNQTLDSAPAAAPAEHHGSDAFDALNARLCTCENLIRGLLEQALPTATSGINSGVAQQQTQPAQSENEGLQEINRLKERQDSLERMLAELKAEARTEPTAAATESAPQTTSMTTETPVVNFDELARAINDCTSQLGELAQEQQALASRAEVTDRAVDAATQAHQQNQLVLADLSAKVAQTEPRLDMLEAQLQALCERPAADVSSGAVIQGPAHDGQLLLLKGTVDGMRGAIERLQKDLDLLSNESRDRFLSAESAVNAHETQLAEIQAALSEMRERCDHLNGNFIALGPQQLRVNEALKHLQDTKANRTDVAPKSDPLVTRDIFDATLDDLRRRIASMEGRQQETAETISPDDLAALTKRVTTLEKRPHAVVNDKTETQTKPQETSQVEAMVQTVMDAAQRNREQIIEIKATIEHIHHTKADSTLVANKAERDYVENALEKLMREVEQVMNSTNAGLIDTLDKSLGILRDMIDGKASKAEVARVRAAAVEEPGSVPEGLAGYKSYRCLGCNRTVDAMRSRPMGSTFNNFMNRLPTSPRPTAPPRTADGTRPSAGYITAAPQ
jgi:chromosome segregation ATPase